MTARTAETHAPHTLGHNHTHTLRRPASFLPGYHIGRRLFPGDLQVARGSVPAEYFQSINPVLILCLTPPISALWRWQAQRGTEPHQARHPSPSPLLQSRHLRQRTAAARLRSRARAEPELSVCACACRLSRGNGLLNARISLSTAGQVVKMAIGCWILGLAFLVLALFSNTEEKARRVLPDTPSRAAKHCPTAASWPLRERPSEACQWLVSSALSAPPAGCLCAPPRA